MILRKYYPTIVLSDIHLGSEHSRTEEVTRFLKHVDCDRLILNGDIIDGWQLKKSGKRWKQKHTDFFKVLMKMMEKRGTEIIYVVGNHDDFLDSLAPFKFSNISIVKDYLLKTRQGKPYFSLSQEVKHRVKSAVSYISEFEKELVRLAEAKHLDGIICGHIHQAASVWYGNVHYLNSGDWVESMTALVEDEQGEWDIVTYNNVQLYADAV